MNWNTCAHFGRCHIKVFLRLTCHWSIGLYHNAIIQYIAIMCRHYFFQRLWETGNALLTHAWYIKCFIGLHWDADSIETGVISKLELL